MKKTVKNYKYYGLGFPVILEEVEVEIIDGEKYYSIDFEGLKYAFLSIIMIDPSIEISGGMLHFVRQSLSLSMDSLANRIGVVKSTILKWENKKEELLKLNDLQKFKIKTEIKKHIDGIIEQRVEEVFEKREPKKASKSKPIRVPSQQSFFPSISSNKTLAFA